MAAFTVKAEVRLNVEQAESANGGTFYEAHEKFALWLERVMLHFSDMEKETERLDARHYRITLHYKRDDETEILIRILSFGPILKVLSPAYMVDQIRQRLDRQFLYRPKE